MKFEEATAGWGKPDVAPFAQTVSFCRIQIQRGVKLVKLVKDRLFAVSPR